MVTKVGMQANFSGAVKDLLELDYDAIEAYETAIGRLDNSAYRSKLTEFMSDHQRHVRELTDLLNIHNEQAPTGPTGKKWLTKGKVILADIIGDDAILTAMLSNEQDTNTAYERMHKRDDKWPDAIEIISRGLQDEKRHKAWLESVTA